MSSQKDKAQELLKDLPLRAGDVFTHYKGGTYEIIALAVKEDTLEPLVIYRAISYNNTVWARTYENWNEDVEMKGKTMKRFIRI